MKYTNYALSLIICLGMHSAYSVNIETETGKEFPTESAIRIAENALRQARMIEMAKFATEEGLLNAKKSAAMLAIKAIGLASSDLQKIDIHTTDMRSTHQNQEMKNAVKAIKIALEALEKVGI